MFQFLYLLGPRVHEVSKSRMNSFYRRSGGWWWRIVGKGNKEASIPVQDELIKALSRYRQVFGFETSLPTSQDNRALIFRLHSCNSAHQALCSDMVWRIVKATFHEVAASLASDDVEQELILKKASTHWMRHTAITHQANQNIDLRYIQFSARHSSIETTQKYLHAEDELWQQSMAVHNLGKS